MHLKTPLSILVLVLWALLAAMVTMRYPDTANMWLILDIVVGALVGLVGGINLGMVIARYVIGLRIRQLREQCEQEEKEGK